MWITIVAIYISFDSSSCFSVPKCKPTKFQKHFSTPLTKIHLHLFQCHECKNEKVHQVYNCFYSQYLQLFVFRSSWLVCFLHPGKQCGHAVAAATVVSLAVAK